MSLNQTEVFSFKYNSYFRNNIKQSDMTIKFFSNYTSSENLLKKFLVSFYISDHQIKFTIAEDYEYAVVFNRTDELINPSAKIITIVQEPSWNIANANNIFLTHSDYLIIHDPQLFEKTYGIHLGGKIIESPSYLFYHDAVDKSFFQYAATTKKIKKLSMIVSYLNKPLGIYQKRTSLLNKILASDLDIDIYGRGLNLEDKRYKGFIDYKFTGLLPYEYSIAIENSNEKNYISEKFIDCILCNTVPIYCGAPNVSEVYDERYFRQIDLDSPSIIDDIRHIISEPSPGTAVNREIYYQKYNLYNTLKEIIA
jgi:hypothetical protein